MSTKNKHKNSFLSFQLGNEIFAITVKKVLAVLQMQYISEMPEMPDYIVGVIGFRGDILSVIDTRVKFKMKPTNLDNSAIIVLETQNTESKFRVCALVDKVKAVIAIDDNDIKPIPEMGLAHNADYLIGMIKSADNFITLLNVDKIFTSHETQLINENILAEKNKTADILQK